MRQFIYEDDLDNDTVRLHPSFFINCELRICLIRLEIKGRPRLNFKTHQLS